MAPRFCTQCALALLVYVATATVLELYWMSNRDRPTSESASSPSVSTFPAGAAQRRQTATAVSEVPPLAFASPPPPEPARDAVQMQPVTTLAASDSGSKGDGRSNQRRSGPRGAAAAPFTATAAGRIHSHNGTTRDAGGCWPMPRPFFEPPFDETFASILWTSPTPTAYGPLEDVPAGERKRDWPADRIARLTKLLPARSEMARRRFKSCAVVGSSPELLLYEDGSAIDAHEAVFRANLAVTSGFEEHAGRHTSVRVINPVESHMRARKAGGQGEEMIIKSQDPPIIRSPSREIRKFMNEVEPKEGSGRKADHNNFLARRSVLELCNYLMLASNLGGDADGSGGSALPAKSAGSKKKGNKRDAAGVGGAPLLASLNLSRVTDAFRAYTSGRGSSWHPMGDAIPRFSPIHCSTGSVLLLQALLTCDRVRLYGYHACSCHARCDANAAISARNHYWDKKETPRFGEMMNRYEHHMRLYQRLERSCDVDFKIARKEHCDR